MSNAGWFKMVDRDGKAVQVSEKHPARVVGLDRQGKTFGFSDEAFIQTIERRIEGGKTNPYHLMTDDEAQRLGALGVGVAVEVEHTKPTTTLADDLIFSYDNSSSLMEKRTEERLRAKLRSAQRFVLTEDAAVKVAEAIRNYPEMLVEQGVFARTPFETCWIEMPSYKYHEALVPGSSSPEADVRVGYLFIGDRVYVGAQNADSKNGNGASFSPLVVHLHDPLSMIEETRLANSLDISRAQLDNFYWGGTMAQELPWDIKRGLRSQHGFSMDVQERFRGKIDGDAFLRFSAGEVRNIIGLLLMLNQPKSVLHTEAVANRRMMTRKGPRVLMGHSIITLNLDKRSRPDRLLRIPRGVHSSPRWHNVVSHWCNDKVSRTRGHSDDDHKSHGRGDHAHLWVQDNDGSLRFTCQICGGRRWRRVMKNGRGDRSKGIVSQERIVKTDRDTDIRDHMF